MATAAGHNAAKELVERIDPSLTPAESLAVRAVAHHETKYGKAWPEGAGKGSHNMGAIMTGELGEACTGFRHKDSNPDGSFTGCFRIYPDDEAGFRDLIKVLLKSNVRAAAGNGDLHGVARAMFDNHYYTGTSKDPETNVNRYEEALTRNLAEIVAATGEENTYTPPKSRKLRTITLALTGAGLFAIVAYGALSVLSGRPKPNDGLRGARTARGRG